MCTYIFRAVRRRADGLVGPTLDQRTVLATDDDAAVRAARAVDIDLGAVGANAVYLAASDGRVIWSLHAAGAPPDGDGPST